MGPLNVHKTCAIGSLWPIKGMADYRTRLSRGPTLIKGMNKPSRGLVACAWNLCNRLALAHQGYGRLPHQTIAWAHIS